MAPRRLILVGGFLGAGKTTLLARAADVLTRHGLKVGLITNDQAEDLVDTELLKSRTQVPVQEVSGGCFCCRFSCLLSASDLLEEESDADVFLAEPVGSCTDISATVIQPLKEFYSGRFSVAPFSVLADPDRLKHMLVGEGPNSPADKISYIFRKQLAEADVIVLNKVDLLSEPQLSRLEDVLAEEFPGIPVMKLSARTGRGVDPWMKLVMEGTNGGQRIAEVDYDVYADCEAELGWLNAVIRLQCDRDVDWREFASGLLTHLQRLLGAQSGRIGHVKLILTAPGCELFADVTNNGQQPYVHGAVEGSPRQVSLTFNARVQIEPEPLREILEASLDLAGSGRMRARIDSIDSFSPARPEPTHRFDRVVNADGQLPAGR